MSKFVTIVIRTPDDVEGKAKVSQAMDLLQPYTTAMSLEDEMTKWDMLEQHPDLPKHVIEDAEIQAAALAAPQVQPVAH